MNARATIQHAKVNGSEYGRESILTLTLDVKLPTPVEVRSINEWAGSELDWNTRQQIAKAQKRRRNGKETKLTKAQKRQQAESHEQGTECSIESCETCYEASDADGLICLAHSLPWQDCHECEGESAIVLDPEDIAKLRGRYETYAAEQHQSNREAMFAAQEAAMFLLLIKKPVHMTIAPAQQAFAELLQLAAPA